jgi:hypothetical protein
MRRRRMRRHCPRPTVLIVEPRLSIVCEDCAGEVEPDRSLRRCPSCSGKLTFTYSLDGLAWPAPGGGMWVYRQLLPLVDPANKVSRGEGDTPLVPAHGDWGCRLYWKNEGLNPTGSHKDRALSLAVSRAREVKAPRSSSHRREARLSPPPPTVRRLASPVWSSCLGPPVPRQNPIPLSTG